MSTMLHLSVQLLFLLFSVTSAENPKSSTAVAKVIKMLEDIEHASEDELFKEQMTFTEFDNWCNNTKEERDASISENDKKEKSLTALIKTKAANIAELTDKISDLEDDIKKDNAKIAKLSSDRATAKAAYSKETDDLSTAITALKKGLDGLQSAKKPSFLQLRGGKQQQPSALAHFLGLKGGAASSFIENANQVLGPDDSHLKGYDFDLSDGLSETLWGILKNMQSAKDTADQDEMKAVNTYMLAVQSEEQTMARHKSSMEAKGLQKSNDMEAKSAAEQSLKTTQDALKADKTYLKDTKTMCADKKAAWLTRKSTREDEIQALGKATKIMQEGMAINASYSSSKSQSMMQFENAAAVQTFHSREEMLAAAEAAAESAEAVHPAEATKAAIKTESSLVQIRSSSVRKEAPELQAVRLKLMSLLRRKSIELQSPVLLSIARSVNGTALDGVKSKLTDLISDLTSKNEDRLVQCEKDRASLDKELNASKTLVFKENSRLAAAEADHAKLTSTANQLKKDLAELDADLAKATAIRNEEAANAAHSIKEAKQGKQAVEMATGVLEKFYGAKADAKAPKGSKLSGSSAQKDAPGPGFDTGEAYKGSGASVAVLGMLDVILDDFKQTLSETEAEETKAIAEFKTFQGETDDDKKAQEKELAATKRTLGNLDLDTASLKEKTSVLKSKLAQLAAVEERCSVGAVAEDRIAKRQAEMDALREAIAYLDQVIPTLR